MLEQAAQDMSLKMRALEQARLSTTMDHLGRLSCRGCGSHRGTPRFSSHAMLAQHLIEKHGGLNQLANELHPPGGAPGGAGKGYGTDLESRANPFSEDAGGGGGSALCPPPQGTILRAHTA